MLWTIDHAARSPLQDQIAAAVRRGLAEGALEIGERLPPAQELAAALAVDRNTVLAAYRTLRDEGVLEFRRGRGVRVAAHPPRAALDAAIRDVVRLAADHGYSRSRLIELIEELT